MNNSQYPGASGTRVTKKCTHRHRNTAVPSGYNALTNSIVVARGTAGSCQPGFNPNAQR